MFPILSYGADLFTPTKGLFNKMDVHWRQVTNCFHSTPVSILAAELCLLPLLVLLTHKRQMVALRLISSPMTINPASARFCRSFSSLLKTSAPDSHRALCKRLALNVMLLNCKTPLPFLPVRTHLPVEGLAHLTVPLFKNLLFALHINSTLLPNLPSLPSNETMTNAYPALRRRVQTLMMVQWRSLPLLSYYPYSLRLSPHLFMGLEMFMAGRIHQMCSQKSNLAAHSTWFNADDSLHFPLCGDEPEMFSHPILHCPTKALAQARHLQGFCSVGYDTPVWFSSSLLRSLAVFIGATGTALPPDMLPSFPPSPVLRGN